MERVSRKYRTLAPLGIYEDAVLPIIVLPEDGVWLFVYILRLCLCNVSWSVVGMTTCSWGHHRTTYTLNVLPNQLPYPPIVQAPSRSFFLYFVRWGSIQNEVYRQCKSKKKDPNKGGGLIIYDRNACPSTYVLIHSHACKASHVFFLFLHTVDLWTVQCTIRDLIYSCIVEYSYIIHGDCTSIAHLYAVYSFIHSVCGAPVKQVCLHVRHTSVEEKELPCLQHDRHVQFRERTVLHFEYKL